MGSLGACCGRSYGKQFEDWGGIKKRNVEEKEGRCSPAPTLRLMWAQTHKVTVHDTQQSVYVCSQEKMSQSVPVDDSTPTPSQAAAGVSGP